MCSSDLPNTVKNRTFIHAKNQSRDSLSGRSAIKSNDDPSRLVDNAANMITKINEMDQKKLLKGSVAVQPWSDYYWALYQGQTAFRYADTKFPSKTENWKEIADFLLSNEAESSSVDALSPAEKYDLLVGDSRKSLKIGRAHV